MRFGLHVSIAGSLLLAVERARKRSCETMQIFAGSPRGWGLWEVARDEAERFRRACAEHGIDPVVVHAPYLVNLASPNAMVFERSMTTVANGLKVSALIGARSYVLHTGNAVTLRPEEGIARVTSALSSLLEADEAGVELLIENISGAGSSVGATFEELASIIDAVNDERLGICFDTCHAFAAGYDLSSASGVAATLAALDARIGAARVRVVHANDSKFPLGSTRDRHEDIGGGYIGREGFSSLLRDGRLRDIPVILETPRMSVVDDLRNLATIREVYTASA